MQSESARMSSAAEARFRIDAPNSKPRAIKIIALDPPSERAVKQLAQAAWSQASFFTASAFSGAPRKDESFSMTGWLSDLAGRTTDLINEVDSADLVVMVATAGESASAAAIIGGPGTTDEALSKTLAQLRPWSLMLVIASGEDYIEDMLVALRA
jgi:hypothetical protein